MSKEALIHIRGAVIVVAMIGSAIALPAPNSFQLLFGMSLIIGSLWVNMFANPSETPSKESSNEVSR